jgi:type IV secretory pathway VirB2 component (pilin)
MVKASVHEKIAANSNLDATNVSFWELATMDTGPLTLLMNFIAPIVFGLALLAGVLWWRNRSNYVAQSRTDQATREIYDEEEDARRKKERN